MSERVANTDCTATETPSALTVKALAEGTAAMSRSSLKVTVSVRPVAPTTALAGSGGVPSAVEMLSTSKSSKALASLPATSAMTVPVSGTA